MITEEQYYNDNFEKDASLNKKTDYKSVEMSYGNVLCREKASCSVAVKLKYTKLPKITKISFSLLRSLGDLREEIFS